MPSKKGLYDSDGPSHVIVFYSFGSFLTALVYKSKLKLVYKNKPAKNQLFMDERFAEVKTGL